MNSSHDAFLDKCDTLFDDLGAAMDEAAAKCKGKFKVRLWVREQQWESVGRWFYYKGDNKFTLRACDAIWIDSREEADKIAEDFGGEVGEG